MGQKDPRQLLMCEKYFDLLKVMEARIIIEINSVLDDKQNAEIRQLSETKIIEYLLMCMYSFYSNIKA